MRKRTIGLLLGISLVSMAFIGGSAVASGDPFAGTWHERDAGTSNIFYFVDEPVGGVYHVLYYDDYTGDPVCGDNGPMLWSGFAAVPDPGDPNTIEGTFGNYWCPDNGDGEVLQNPFGLPSEIAFGLAYDPATDTIEGIGGCVGTRQPHITTVDRAIQELEKGKFPPSDSGLFLGCGT